MADTLNPEALAPAQLLAKLGAAPRKGLGQNFLVGQSAIKQIISALEPDPSDTIVEIGAGLGVVTGFIAATKARVLAIELDDKLAEYLKNRFSPVETVQVIHRDILETTLNDLPLSAGASYKVIGNLPYYITSSAIRHVLYWEPLPERLVIMVQEEVARRIVARPGDMSLLSLMVQLRARAEIVHRVPAGAFVPPPKVASAIVRITPDPCRLLTPEIDKALFLLARAGFQQKRKTLLNSLSTAIPFNKEEVSHLLEETGLTPKARAQELSVQQWLELTHAYLAKQSSK